jgi:hypothetical protein
MMASENRFVSGDPSGDPNQQTVDDKKPVVGACRQAVGVCDTCDLGDLFSSMQDLIPFGSRWLNRGVSLFLAKQQRQVNIRYIGSPALMG